MAVRRLLAPSRRAAGKTGATRWACGASPTLRQARIRVGGRHPGNARLHPGRALTDGVKCARDARQGVRRPALNHQHCVRAMSSASAGAAAAVASSKVHLPELADPRARATVSEWHVAVGQVVSSGDVLCDVETEDAVIEVHVQDGEGGRVAQILRPVGPEELEQGEILAILEAVEEEAPTAPEEAEPVGGVEEKEENQKQEEAGGKASASSRVQAGDGQGAGAAASSGSRNFSTSTTTSRMPGRRLNARHRGYHTHPSSRGLSLRLSPAASHHAALNALLNSAALNALAGSGSGKHGMVTKGDVLRLASGGASKPVKVTPAPTTATTGRVGVRDRSYGETKPSNMRKTIAKRLLQSKQETPHAYVAHTCNIDGLLAFRSQLKGKLAETEERVPSLNDFVIRAAALALRAVPEVNCIWDAKAGQAVAMDTVDISIAVATDAGLITPIVKSADRKRVLAISGEVRELAGKAKANTLQPEEFIGGSFSISNLGMFGVEHFTAVINPPQVGILAVGGGQRSTTIDAETMALKTETNMTVTLSYDERALDASAGAHFLEEFATLLSHPQSLL